MSSKQSKVAEKTGFILKRKKPIGTKLEVMQVSELVGNGFDDGIITTSQRQGR